LNDMRLPDIPLATSYRESQEVQQSVKKRNKKDLL